MIYEIKGCVYYANDGLSVWDQYTPKEYWDSLAKIDIKFEGPIINNHVRAIACDLAIIYGCAIQIYAEGTLLGRIELMTANAEVRKRGKTA